MKKWFLTIAVIATVTNVWGQIHPDGYLTEETALSNYFFVAPPPELTESSFFNDFYYYQWGRKEREQLSVSEMALYDEGAELYEAFGQEKILEINLTPETTPEIILLCERSVTDANKANTIVKNTFQRVRPFATFHDASLKPETDDEEAKTFSYPSGHSTRGFMFALTLCTVAPEFTSEIMERAQQYAMNRVICGHHWKSDIDASLLLASAMFANVVCTDEHQAQLKKARAEYKSITGGGTRVEAPTAEATSKSAAIYDMQGRQLNAKPNDGIYIQNGEKYVSK